MTEPTFRPLARDELDLALDWAAEEGWNPGLADAAAFWAADPGGYWGIELDGALVGCGSAVSYDRRYGFAGLFIVQPGLRGRGVGAAAAPFLVGSARARLDDGAALAIDGVFAMQPYYASLGFVFTHRNLRLEGVGRRDRGAADGLVLLRDLPFDDVVAFDAPRFGARRPGFLRHWIDPDGGLGLASLDDDGVLDGIGVVRPCRRGFKVGPLFATTPAAARHLLAALSDHAAGEPLVLDVPEPHADAMALAAEHGMTEVFGCARMVMGPAPAIAWDEVYGVTTFELG